MKRVLLAAAGLVAFTAQSALAADMKLPVKAAPVQVEEFNWSGFYVGINGGAKFLRSDGTPGSVTAGVVPPSTIPIHFNGDKAGTFGAQAGWNWQFSKHLLVGIEGDFNWTGLNSRHTLGGTQPVPFVGSGVGAGNDPDFFTSRMRWESSIRGRAGWVAGRGMIYVTGGAAFADVTVGANFPVFTGGGVVFPASSGSSSRTLTGWTAGGGAEFAIAQNWSLGTEYRYANYGRHSFATGVVAASVAPGGGFNNVPVSVTHEFATHELLLKLNYRFSWSGPVVASY